MTRIKSHTDLEQSCKLAEFLPVEAADMCWTNHYYGGLRSSLRVSSKSIEEYKNMLESFHDSTDADVFYPCWSLAALFGVLPKYELNNFGDTIQLDANLEALATEGDETLLDLVVNMIIHLHELKKL